MNKPARSIAGVARRSLVATLTALAVAGAAGCSDGAGPGTPRRDDALTPSELFRNLEGGDFPPVDFPWQFRFPRDHGAHGRYRTEWWHLAGVLAVNQDSRLGVQLSVARVGLKPGPLRSDSRWAATDIYWGRLSLSGSRLDGPRSHQRVSRGALGLAGAQSRPVRIWLENWRLEQLDGADRALDLNVRVAAEELEFELELRSTKPLLDANAIPGQRTGQPAPFVFYIQPRMQARGTIAVQDQPSRVRGIVSLEHAWGELPLPGGPVARDRFTLYLGEERELFCIRTHRLDGSGTPTTNCLLVDREGSPLALSDNEVQLEPLEHRQSERTGACYPTRWALRIPDHGIQLEIVPLSDQTAGGDGAASRAGPVSLRLASDEPAGYGFVQLEGCEDS